MVNQVRRVVIARDGFESEIRAYRQVFHRFLIQSYFLSSGNPDVSYFFPLLSLFSFPLGQEGFLFPTGDDRTGSGTYFLLLYSIGFYSVLSLHVTPGSFSLDASFYFSVNTAK